MSSTFRIQNIESQEPKPPVHDLWNGIFCWDQWASVHQQRTNNIVNSCGLCYSHLPFSTMSPPYTLANNMWIGRVHLEFQILTFLEWFLIAHPFIFVAHIMSLRVLEPPKPLPCLTPRKRRLTTDPFDDDLHVITRRSRNLIDMLFRKYLYYHGDTEIFACTSLFATINMIAVDWLQRSI
jgi:hypothetical protein